MVKLVALYKKPAETEEFDKHYNDIHIPLVKKYPGLRRLEVTRITGAPIGDTKFYAMAEMYFDSRQALDAALASKQILYGKGDWRATITINRPEVYNCLNLETLREMGAAMQDAAWDDHVAVLIITGAGSKAFCTGADMKEWKEEFLESPNDFYKWMGVFIETFERLRNLGKPTIARLNGMVVGGGNELQMSCDLAVAASDIFIRHAGTSRGSVAAAGATQWLPLIVGDRRAREILLLN
jgi:uncharacterized protein (TIGR02118 family)